MSSTISYQAVSSPNRAFATSSTYKWNSLPCLRTLDVALSPNTHQSQFDSPLLSTLLHHHAFLLAPACWAVAVFRLFLLRTRVRIYGRRVEELTCVFRLSQNGLPLSTRVVFRQVFVGAHHQLRLSTGTWHKTRWHGYVLTAVL